MLQRRAADPADPNPSNASTSQESRGHDVPNQEKMFKLMRDLGCAEGKNEELQYHRDRSVTELDAASARANTMIIGGLAAGLAAQGGPDSANWAAMVRANLVNSQGQVNAAHDHNLAQQQRQYGGGAQQPQAQHSDGGGGTNQPLLEGWKEAPSTHGVYYYHENGDVTWQRPGLPAPPPLLELISPPAQRQRLN